MMRTTQKTFLLVVATLGIHQAIHARVTSLQPYDAMPLYNAANLGCPVNAHMSGVQHAHLKDMYEQPERFCVGLQISPFYQKAIRATDGTTSLKDVILTPASGTTPAVTVKEEEPLYYGIAPSTSTVAGALGDLYGTTYLMGLFLGADPSTGGTIWNDSFVGQNQLDPSINTDATKNLNYNIGQLNFPSAISNAAAGIYDLFYYNNNTYWTSTPGGSGTTGSSAAGTGTSQNPPSDGTNYPAYGSATYNALASTPVSYTDKDVLRSSSILNPSTLQRDNKYFASLSVPFTYERMGARFEANVEITKSLGFYVRTGFAQIKNNTTGYTDLTTDPLATKQLSYNSNNLYITSLYNGLYNSQLSNQSPELFNNNGGSQTGVGPYFVGSDPAATAAFNANVRNNLVKLFGKNGIDYHIENWSWRGIEDVEAGIFLRHPFVIHPRESKAHIFENLILTPYLTIAGTLATADVKDYSQALSFAAGNNGHNSLGAELGLTFDFNSTIEVGTKIGFTHFFAHDFANRPCPTHELQRVIYPFKTDLRVEPGYNWHTGVCMNAYHFVSNVSFYMSYDFINHTKNSTKLIKANQYFKPELLDAKSAWSSHYLTTAFDFALHDQIHFSISWQMPIKQEMAYATHSFMGSIGFLF